MCYGRNAQGGTISIGNWHEALLFTLILLCATEAAVVYDELPSKNCSDIDQTCGSLNIPYPFGTRAGCYKNEDFLITCNRNYNPPLAFLRKGNINVTYISLSGELRVDVNVAQDCYKKGVKRSVYSHSGPNNYNQYSSINLSKFPISHTKNKFTAIGCDTYALIKGSSGTAYTTGCMSLCSKISDVVDGSCSGIGCCQTAIPKGVMDYRIDVSSYFNHTNVSEFNPCSYAFVAEEETYNFSSKDLKDFTKRHETTQVVLNWAIGNQTCTEAKKDHPQKFACTNNSDCHDSDNGPGYWCNCSKGFEGNPYLPNGCQGYNTNFNIQFYIDYRIPLSFFNGLLTFFILFFEIHLHIFLQILMSASKIPTLATKIQHASI